MQLEARATTKRHDGMALDEDELSRLYELDRTHWLHPQGDLGAGSGAAPQLMFARGEGATLTDVHGRTYIDAMASLWNVNVGYGRDVLAEAAATQMRRLAFSSGYGGFSHEPGIRLAERLAELAPAGLETTFFASGGAEANDTAYKIARLYWKLRGEPRRVQIVSRLRDYHGLTIGAMSATGISTFWKNLDPLAPGFLHAAAPDSYRYEPDGSGRSAGEVYARSVEEVILKAGPDTVAAVVVEPVQGAGGVLVPPSDYFPLLRAICHRYQVLLIADEVITGFGRTGTWFGLQHWGVAPDMMIFAKGVTSGYLPLSGVMITRAIHATLKTLKGVFPHGFTYSGHPVACAVALENLRLIEQEGLVPRAAEAGRRLLAGLENLRAHEIVGDVRGLGLLAAVEFVRDRARKTPFDPTEGVARRVWLKALEHGVIFRPLPGDVLAMSPPLVIADEQIEAAVSVLDRAIQAVATEL
ncbi:MAG TPA: aspartate aminotransferase family protein [Candidatus Limnocylindrales bacterium]|nr:aspartate aminotransferase family protein [Candidatus Limnocylindrales bacterium]